MCASPGKSGDVGRNELVCQLFSFPLAIFGRVQETKGQHIQQYTLQILQYLFHICIIPSSQSSERPDSVIQHHSWLSTELEKISSYADCDAALAAIGDAGSMSYVTVRSHLAEGGRASR